jgi:hypothetical protein
MTNTYEQQPFDPGPFIDNPGQRCPCLLLLDVSASMSGRSIEELNAGLILWKDELSADPLALNLAVQRFFDLPRVLSEGQNLTKMFHGEFCVRVRSLPSSQRRKISNGRGPKSGPLMPPVRARAPSVSSAGCRRCWDPRWCPRLVGGNRFFLRYRDGYKESLQRRFAKVPAPLMRPSSLKDRGCKGVATRARRKFHRYARI